MAAAIPIIAMTANVQDSIVEHCRAAGMNDYIAEPFRPSLLRSLLARYALKDSDTPAASEAV